MPSPKTPEAPTIDLDAMPVDAGDPTPVPDTGPDPDLMAAMDAGIAGDPLPEPTPPEAKEPEPPASDDPASIPGTPEHAAAEAEKAAKPDEPKPDEKTPEAQAEDARRAEVDKEADALGIRNAKTRERFHDLNAQIAKQAPLVGLLDKAGVKDPKGVEDLIGNAQAAVDIVGMVKETGADATQYTMALDYLTNANLALQKGDLAAAERCYGWMLEELKHYAGMLGKEVPGMVDPLAAHPDLVADLEDERITRERALEIAESRARGNATKVVQDRQTQAKTAQEQQQAEQTQAIDAGKQSLNALGAELAKTDPGKYQAVLPQLKAAIGDIAKTFPPDQWAAATRQAFRLLQMPQAAPKPATGQNVGPVRSSGPVPPMNKQFDNALDALEAGIDAADSRY